MPNRIRRMAFVKTPNSIEMNRETLHRRLGTLVLLTGPFFVCHFALAQSDTSRVATVDSSGYNPNALAEGQKALAKFLRDSVGADLFLEGDAYWFHFGKVGFFSLTGGGALGLELRVRPVFFGLDVGASSTQMRPRPSGSFGNVSYYAGAIIADYRVEIGKIYGETFNGSQGAPEVGHRTYFAGVSKRFGSNFFVEPDIRLMLPVDAGYYAVNQRDHNDVIVESYNMSDLFLSFTVKVGLGVGYCR